MIKMKDSGIPWIGQIPEGWEIKRNKNVMVKKKDICYDYNNQNILSLTMKGVIKRDLDNPIGKMPSSFNGYQEIHKNNLLLCLFDIDVTPRCVGIIKDDGLTSPAYNQYVLIDNNNPYYFCYLLQSLDDDKVFIHLSKNLRSSLTDEDFGYIFTICPPQEIQQKIVEILDKNCGQIDELVRIEENEIEKLKEYKTSLITKVVTKGLDPNAKMKDSVIPWIGQIPEDWKVGRLKNFYLNRIEKYNGQNLNYFALENIESWSGRFIETENIYDKKESILCYKNDCVFGKLRPYLAKAFLLPFDMCCSSEFAIFYSKINNTKYLFYCFISFGIIDVINSSTYGTKMPRANIEYILNLQFAIPTVIEQQQIVDYLDKRCEEIDNLIKIKQEKIEKLKEYKKSLIYQYVTGKKEIV